MGLSRPDQRPPLVGEVRQADSLYGPPSASDSGDGIAEGRRDSLNALVRRFAPTVVLQGGDYTRDGRRKLRLIPSDERLYTDTLHVESFSAAPYATLGTTSIPFQELPAESLASLVDAGRRYESDPRILRVWYFDFPGNTPREWWQEYRRLRTGPDSTAWAQPTVYAHPFVDPAGRVIIQYWYFYVMNDFLGNHEGDWEHINVVTDSTHTHIAEVHYFFHARSIRLPNGRLAPEIVDGTHPVVHSGGRPYSLFDAPQRILFGERNEGSHGSYPFDGEYEGAAGLGTTESIGRVRGDSDRVLRHERFRVILTPDPVRIDYRRRPEVLKRWAWLLLPLQWGYPRSPSLARTLAADVGNHAPYGPAYSTGWNRLSAGMLFADYDLRRISPLRSAIEDLLQPWYYAYIFRTPRYVHDTRGTLSRADLERLGLAPRGGWGERGIGGTVMGIHQSWLRGDSATVFGHSSGISVWGSLWGKIRFGGLELTGGYQRFPRRPPVAGALIVYPIMMNIVARTGEGFVRPYASLGAGAIGWESRLRVSGSTQFVTPGWAVGWTVAGGLEYYLRPRVAFDVAVHYQAPFPHGQFPGVGREGPRFTSLWIGHYLRF